MRVCARNGCLKVATQFPVLEWYPKAAGYTGPPAEMHIGLEVCAVHGSYDVEETARLRLHFLPMAYDACVLAGKAEPDEERTRLRWERIQ